MKKLLSVLLAIALLVVSLDITALKSSAAAVDIDKFSEYLYTEAQTYEQNIDVTKFVRNYGWSVDELKKYSGFALLNKPEMYFVSNTYRVAYTADGSYYILFNYIYTKSQKQQMDINFKAAAKKAAQGVTDKMSDAEKALIVHDNIVLNCKYDNEHKRYSAYDCLVTGSAVCQGYTLAYKYVLENICGIKCSAVVSTSQNHVWNYVSIDGKWYHADLTADDASFKLYNGAEYDGYGEVMHKNVLLSDSGCKNSSGLHRNWEVVGGFPAASDKTYDKFFWTDSTSQIQYYNGLYYYVTQDPDSSMFSSKKTGSKSVDIMLCSYSFKKNTSKKLCSFNTAWYAARNASTGAVYDFGKVYIKRSFSKIVILNGNIYLNTAQNVFRYDIKNKKTKKIYTLKKDNMQIFSIRAVSSNKIRVCYKSDMTYKDNYLNLNIKV